MTKRSFWELLVITLVVAVGLGVLAGVYFVTAGVSARPQPSRLETALARTVRDVAIGWHAGHPLNPVPNDDDAIAEGRAHFADHCASCHANDGSGDTEMGRGLYPRVPDLRLPATQNLEDHQLFYIIENGVRLTGMPAFGTGTKAGEEESWRLVRFIRHLPRLSQAEIAQMEDLNPRTPAEMREREAEKAFLQGGDVDSPPATPTHEHAR